jgi:hypothetical protein
MPSSRVAALTRQDITTAARNLRWTRQMTKWSVIVEGRELPVRPLILEAAGVPPNDPTNSHQAVEILKQQGFDVRYRGKTMRHDGSEELSDAEFEALLRRLRGSLKGPHSLLKDREREHLVEKDWSR